MTASIEDEECTGAQISPVYLELGFSTQEVVDAWQDVRLAEAIQRTFHAAGCPADASAFWCAGWGDCAFIWYLSPGMAALLDEAGVTWRRFVRRRSSTLPPQALAFPMT